MDEKKCYNYRIFLDTNRQFLHKWDFKIYPLPKNPPVGTAIEREYLFPFETASAWNFYSYACLDEAVFDWGPTYLKITDTNSIDDDENEKIPFIYIIYP